MNRVVRSGDRRSNPPGELNALVKRIGLSVPTTAALLGIRRYLVVTLVASVSAALDVSTASCPCTLAGSSGFSPILRVGAPIRRAMSWAGQVT
jgi:hypothetical protein